MKKSTYIGIVIIILLMLFVLVIFAFTGDTKNTSSNVEKNVINKEEQKENKQVNEQTNEIESNEIVNQEVENSIPEEGTQPEENVISTETFEESPKTAEEKALELVKKDWGEGANIEFSIDGIDGNGNYIITVRNSQTTEALAFYNVNTNNGTFTKREII